MRIPAAIANKKGGFALIVVLSSLAILTIIFSVASSRTMSRLLDGASERVLADRRESERSLIELALHLKSSAAGREMTTFTTLLEGNRQQIFLQDVGGLIDLNTAAPDILERLIQGFGLEPDSFNSYINWRRSGHRLLRVGDFLRITGNGPDQLVRLQTMATVHSGRRGIAVELAPIEVLELFTGKSGARETLIAEIPQIWLTPPSGVNFAVGLVNETGAQRLLGVVHIGQEAGAGRLIAFD